MTQVYSGELPITGASDNGFEELDKAYDNYRPTTHDLARFGLYALHDALILDRPTSVAQQGEVLTNPSQIEISDQGSFAYFRQEPPVLHLGNTRSVPFLLRQDGEGNPYLAEFEGAKTLEGEDPRVTRGVKIKGLLGKVHEGWLVSTTVATPMADNPAYVEGIRQVFHWGETLDSLEPIVELEDTKNTTIYPLATDYNDTRLDVFARPKPDISYLRLPDITALNNDLIESAGINITQDFLPEGVHCGPNFVKGAGQHYRELDIHEAYLEPVDDERAALHYRLGRYGYELPTRGLPGGRLIPLGVLATRNQFPNALPKPPENGVADYKDVLYGSMGHGGRMIVGVSDSQIGLASVTRIR